jgi:inner membrane protein
VLAANLPDIDVIFGWVPWEPLATHRGFTHGLVGGVLVLPPLLAGLLWLLDRWQARRGRIKADAPPLHFGWLLALSYLAALTHPLLDLQNIYAVQLLSPFSDRWFHTDGLFIISPWLLALLGGGIWMARRKASGKPAVAALAASALFIMGNIGISALAWDAPRMDAPYASPDRIFASPEPLAFWRRDVIWRQNGAITFGKYDPIRRPLALTEFGKPVADNMADPVVAYAARATPQARKFLAWSQLPLARIEPDGRCRKATFGDARFTGPALSRNFSVAVTRCMVQF